MPIPPLAAAHPHSVVVGVEAMGGAVAPAWDGIAWTGAALYLLLFAGALFGIWRILRDSPGGEGGG